MSQVLKWLRISSNQLDRLRKSWNKAKIARAKIPVEHVTSKIDRKSAIPEVRQLVATVDILWGDLHFLYIALTHLLKALKKTSTKTKFDKELAKDIELLRHIFEHWDAKKISALKGFKARHPGVNPYSIDLIPFVKFEVSGIDIGRIQSLILKLENELEL